MTIGSTEAETADKAKRKRRHRNRRRRRRRKDRSVALVPTTSADRRKARLFFQASSLEIAAGHDGFLRGNPEPVVVVAAYLRRGEAIEMSVRTLFRYQVTERAPCQAEAIEQTPRPRSPRVALADGEVVVLVVAIEEDAGHDVEALYASMNDVEALVVWPLDGATPVPLSDVSTLMPAGRAMQVGLQAPGGPPIDTFRVDDYVGTSALWFPCAGLTNGTECRAPIRSRDGRNDWTVQFWLRVK